MVVVAVGVAQEALVAVEEGVLVEGVEVVEGQEDLVASNADLKSS